MSRIFLNEWIEAIRLDLQTGVQRAASQDASLHPLRFELSEVTIEVAVETGRDVEGTGGIKFWVVEAGAAASSRHAETQKLTITLRAKGDTELGDAAEGDILAQR